MPLGWKGIGERPCVASRLDFQRMVLERVRLLPPPALLLRRVCRGSKPQLRPLRRSNLLRVQANRLSQDQPRLLLRPLHRQQHLAAANLLLGCKHLRLRSKLCRRSLRRHSSSQQVLSQQVARSLHLSRPVALTSQVLTSCLTTGSRSPLMSSPQSAAMMMGTGPRA